MRWKIDGLCQQTALGELGLNLERDLMLRVKITSTQITGCNMGAESIKLL